jgi:hypothetical protein
VPWGFNYDHDEKGRLLEDYWEKEWPKVAQDFVEMRDLGANTVRIHLQVGRFLKSPDEPDHGSLGHLARLVSLAEETGLYLDLTGLGCYHKADVPAWYDALDETRRWEAQARFWETVAATCAKSPAIFCYDLMNEPVVPGGDRKPGDWLGPPFGGKHFVQFITLSQGNRARSDIARAWVERLVKAVRQHDRRGLVTVGLVDWSLERPGLTSGFVPDKVAQPLDFVAVHVYPKKGEVEKALETLRGFAIGKPVVIEETFPLLAPLPEFERFLKESEKVAAGWIGFYWGKTPAELRQANSLADALMLGWLELFEKRARSRPQR